MGNIIGKSGTIVIILLVVIVIVVFFMPQVRQWMLNLRAEEISIVDPAGRRGGSGEGTLDLKIVTVLGRDGIPAILNPIFIPASDAVIQMEPGERVLGVSINGDHRAYPLNLLSRHEIVGVCRWRSRGDRSALRALYMPETSGTPPTLSAYPAS